jgi:uncharacterized protein YyaL (SSP411 family)/Fe-S cluster biogenesis protein NfuA
MPNQLANETSPYLLQHANNPVDWHAWGPEALKKSKDEDKPIFLSIGYSACHWCHVMEHESFENDDIASTLNEHFVSIKVDREERPDLDQIYMNAVQIMTGRGGWPMSMFLTPDLKPFFGGTYWPPTSKMGMPGFDQVLTGVIDAWRKRRPQAIEQADELTKQLQQIAPPLGSGQELQLETLMAAQQDLEQSCDRVNGGFGSTPKFPHPMALQLLMRICRRQPNDQLLDLIRLNLDKMADGGIYDQLAGGFARYSVDSRWLVPHFEKMLYDNALLADTYLDGFLLTKNSKYARVARETLDYILNYMTDSQGGFHSTEDADSEGVEGKFYVWTPSEIRQTLGDRADRFCHVYDVTDQGNFEGQNILNLPKTIDECARLKGWDRQELEAELAQSRAKLLKVRDKRVRPGKDDKILASWNGLMIHTMARAAGILDDERYVTAATRAAEFIFANMVARRGRLLHSWRNGQAKCDAYLDDYATLINALVTLYEAGFDERWIDGAVGLADILMEKFHDNQAGGFFYTANDHEALIARNKELYDNATPSSNAMAATGLLRLGKLCGRSTFVQVAEEVLRLGAGVMERSAIAGGQLMIALDMQLGPTPEIVILGDQHEPETAAVLHDLRRRYVPNRVVACRAVVGASGSPNLTKLFMGKAAQDGSPTVFVCENFACQAPVVGKEQAIQAWKKLEQGTPIMSPSDISITGEPITDATCRFTIDRPVYPEKSFAFLNKEAAQGSPLAQRLFEIDGITRVLISHDQITVNKSSQADWPLIGKSIGTAIRAHLATDDPAVSDSAWETVPSSEEIRERVQQVLDTEINPSVAEHGGIITLIDVKQNQVYLQMGGGCQGCGQADVTLKFGIENAIRAAVPGVGDILDVTDHASGRNPYHTPSKK